MIFFLYVSFSFSKLCNLKKKGSIRKELNWIILFFEKKKSWNYKILGELYTFWKFKIIK